MRLFPSRMQTLLMHTRTRSAKRFFDTAHDDSRPNSISTLSIEGVCVVPATSRRTGIASLRHLQLVRAEHRLQRRGDRFLGPLDASCSAAARSASAGRTASVTCCASASASGAGVAIEHRGVFGDLLHRRRAILQQAHHRASDRRLAQAWLRRCPARRRTACASSARRALSASLM